MIDQLLILDWNGTFLADTAAAVGAENKAILEAGGRPVDIVEYRQRRTIPGAEFYLSLGCRQELLTSEHERFAKTMAREYEQNSRNVRTRKGIRAVLRLASEKKVQVVILSNDIEDRIRWHLRRLNLDESINDVVARRDYHGFVHRKGKSDALRKYLDTKGLRQVNALSLGDSPEDIRIAKKFGISAIGVGGGNFSKKRLTDAGADRVFSSVAKAYQWLVKRWGEP